MKTYLVTGGAGFIGSNFVLREWKSKRAKIINLDLLTYAGNQHNFNSLGGDPNHIFVKGDITDRELVRDLLERYRPNAVVHFAAESHVDRSIDGPADFIQTNVVGTFHLLEETRRYWNGISPEEKKSFRFLHVSTDEVYGSLAPDDPPFREDTPYAPNSPYSASKAASDHLVRAYFHTYGLPVLTTNCSNNYGPMQFPEKLIPLVILNAYNIGGRCEKTNLDMVRTICAILDELRSDSPYEPHASLIAFVKDRPDHDRRYAIDSSKTEMELGWYPKESIESGLRKTIEWYLTHAYWIKSVKTGGYRKWIMQHYG